MKDNIPGFIGYHVSKTGNVYSRYVRGSRGKLSKTLLRVLGKRFGVGDRIIRNIINNSYENKEDSHSKR